MIFTGAPCVVCILKRKHQLLLSTAVFGAVWPDPANVIVEKCCFATHSAVRTQRRSWFRWFCRPLVISVPYKNLKINIKLVAKPWGWRGSNCICLRGRD